MKRICIAASTIVLCACAQDGGDNLDAVTTAVMLPVTTASEDARNHFRLGQQALDVGRFIEANAHFEQAVAADSLFAFAYLQVANSGSSLSEFTTNLGHAERHAAHASQAEQTQIAMARKGFQNDVEGQLTLGQSLTQSHGDNARAWLILAGIQEGMNRIEDARASIRKALELAPRFLPAHTQLGNSFLFSDPKDFAQAEAHMQHAVDLAPNEANMHDFLADAHRAQGQLESALAGYSRAHELRPNDALPLQQRGHVNSFLGNYDAARADYDSAIARGRANEAAAFRIWRALVGVHAGESVAAIAELNQLVSDIDGMDIPEPRGLKIGALFNIAVIGIHTGNFAAAERALDQRRRLMTQQGEAGGTPEFRRNLEAGSVYMDAWLAARKGQLARANQLTQRMTTLVEPDANPRKMEPVHEVKGFIALARGNAAEAVTHFEQGNPFSMYTKYQLAVAHEGAGHREQAQRLYGEVADYNFNDVFAALVRANARAKAAI